MKRSSIITVMVFGFLLSSATLPAQDTNPCSIVPATKLEAFETNVGNIIIKAITELGVISAKTAAISVKCKEFTDTATRRKEQGIAVEIGRLGLPRDVMLIDYDEMASLLNAI